MSKSKPKYNQGDRLGVWKIVSVHYGGEQFGYVYDLIRFEGARKRELTCTEKVLDEIVNKAKST